MLLADVPDTDLARVAIEIARGPGAWWPEPGQVLDAARRRPAMLDGRELWGLIRPHLRRDRLAEQQVARLVPAEALAAVLAAIESVGWERMCNASDEEVGHLARNLAEAYTVAAGRAAYVAETGQARRVLDFRRGIGSPEPLTVVEGERPGLAAWARGGGGE